jgi:hypothetical protein
LNKRVAGIEAHAFDSGLFDDDTRAWSGDGDLSRGLTGASDFGNRGVRNAVIAQILQRPRLGGLVMLLQGHNVIDLASDDVGTPCGW